VSGIAEQIARHNAFVDDWVLRMKSLGTGAEEAGRIVLRAALERKETLSGLVSKNVECVAASTTKIESIQSRAMIATTNLWIVEQKIAAQKEFVAEVRVL
jgi:hypothetical protein